jgi:hypothetical protein
MPAFPAHQRPATPGSSLGHPDLGSRILRAAERVVRRRTGLQPWSQHAGYWSDYGLTCSPRRTMPPRVIATYLAGPFALELTERQAPSREDLQAGLR